MKKIVFLFVFLFISLSSFCYDFVVDGICYNITSTKDKTVEVTYKTNDELWKSFDYEGHISIPSQVSYNGVTFSVTGIGQIAFSNNANLTSIDFPNTINIIGEGAFYQCSGLTSVIIPNSVTSIGGAAFYYWSKIPETMPAEDVVHQTNDVTFLSCKA